MKKKICLLLFFLLCVCLTGTALTGCVKQHSYTLVSTTESTCTVAGVEVYSCTDCGKQKTTPLPLAPHAEVRHEGKAPTCIAEGWAEYVTCSSCDYTTYEALPATGVHTWDEGEVTKAPTCEGFGERTYQCIHCENASMTERIAASGHSIISYEGKDPTCSEVGWAAYEACENCDYTTYEEIPATGEHEWDEGKITQIPTCVSVGVRTYTCTVCFDATRAEEIPPTGIHTWSEGVVTKEPSCVSVGERTYTCTVCSKAKMTEEISATGHKTVTHNAKAPTCAKIGWAEYVTCLSCDYTTYEAIPATGEHKWDEGTVTKEPSCEVAGQRSYRCTTCSGAFRVEAISPTGHSYSTDWSSNEEYHYHACACGDRADEARHISSGSASLTEAEVCTVCGYIIHEKLAYDPNLILELSDSGYKLVGLHDKNVSEVIIPDIVTAIGEAAFADCASLTSVVIPDSVTTIGNEAFYNCTNLTSVVIPDSVTTIGVGAFYHCSSLTNISVDEGNVVYKSIDGNLYSKDGKELVQYAIGKKDSSFTVPDSVTTIGYYAFYYCTSLTSVVIGDSVKTIGHRAFYSCTSLTSVVIPDSVTTIGDYAFSSCSSLTNISVDEGNTAYKSIDGNLYSKDGKELVQYAIGKKDSSFTIPNSVTTIGDYAFSWCDSLTSVVIGKSVTTIGDAAFLNCASLTSVVIGDSVTRIGEYAFYGCSSLTEVYYKGTAEEWAQISIGTSNSKLTNATRYYYSETQPYEEGNYWHYNAEGEIEIWEGYVAPGSVGLKYTLLSDGTYSVSRGTCTDTEIVIPATYEGKAVTTIGYRAFSNCTSLTSVVIPDSVTTIGNYAFEDCKNLTSVEIPDSVTTIGVGAFYHCASLTNISVDEGNTAYKSIDANLYSKDGKELVQYAIGKKDSSFTIPNSVTTIGNEAFYNCTNLTSVVIGSSVTTIGDYAFYWCTNLTSVVIPDSVTTIGDRAFYYCKSLTSVVIGDFVTTIGEWAFAECTSLTSVVIPDSVTLIGNYAFYYCTSLTSVEIGDSVTAIGIGAFYRCTSLTSVVIGDSVTTIGNFAFYECTSLTSVVIPDSVTTIGAYAFNGCSGLTEVYYKGTAEEWSNISVGSDNTPLTDATRYYYRETQPYEEGNYWHYNEKGEIEIWEVIIASKGLSYKPLSDDTYEVSGIGNCSDRAIVIPASYEGKAVTAIGSEAFYDCYSLTRVEIPDSVTTIGEYAFYGCEGFTEVLLPEGVVTVGEYAFAYCYLLNSVYIPDTVTEISDRAFYCCYKLASVRMGNRVERIGEDAFYEAAFQNIIIPQSVREIGEGAFQSCDSLTSVVIPKGVTKIGKGAFSLCNALSDIYVVEDNAYYRSIDGNLYTKDGKVLMQYAIGKAAESFVLPEGVTTVKYYAFSFGTLKQISLPASLSTVEGKAMMYCYSLNSITVAAANPIYKSIDGNLYTKDGKILLMYAIGKTSASFTVPAGVTSVASYAFYCCNTLKSVTVAGDVTAIGEYAFSDCTSLETVTFGNKLLTVGAHAFSYCDKLKSVVIPNSVTEIGNLAFYGCDGIGSVTVGSGVVRIGYCAFGSCDLDKVIFRDTTTWYCVESRTDWKNGTGGTNAGVSATDTVGNANRLSTLYAEYYWYKK